MPMKETLTIRAANRRDVDAIVDGNARMALETEHRRLDAAGLERGVEAVLTDNRRGRYWVAEREGSVVGQLMVTYEWSDWRNATMWWIQSVYVVEAARRTGVFTMLYRHVEALARRDPDCGGLRLYVETGNERAQAVYRALGMRLPGYVVMEDDFADTATTARRGERADESKE